MGWGGGKGYGGGGGGIASVIQALIGGGGGGGWDNSWGGKGKGKGKGKNSLLKHKTKTSPENCVWIGGLESGAKSRDTNKKLQAHFEKQGAPAKYVEIGFKGAGGAIFGSSEEAAAAIAAVNGTKFDGKTLEVDVWTKKEKY